MNNLALPKNDSFNKTDYSTNKETQHIKILQLFVYSLIVAVGSAGNAAICALILTRKKIKTSEYFILNLAIVDLATCAISIPLDIIEQVTELWPYGSFLCKLVYPTQTILIAVSVATLVAMSLERYRAIMYPLKPKMKGTVTKISIAIIWIGSVVLVSPYILVLTHKNSQCLENWPGDETALYARAFTLTMFVLLYACPLFGISVAYAMVGKRLYRDINAVDGVLLYNVCNSSDSSEQRKMRARRNARVIRIFAAAVVTFAVCMLPNHLIWLWNDFNTEGDMPLFSDLRVFAQILVYANSSLNPFIFGTLHIRHMCCRRSSDSGPKPRETNQRLMTMRMSFSSSSKHRATVKLLKTDSRV